jgi:RimJ/RimL family protein N-acetyltransferase
MRVALLLAERASSGHAERVDEPTVAFRPLVTEDLRTIAAWFTQPEVARWWNPPTTIDAVRAKYQPRIDGTEPTLMWIVELNGTPGGLVQTYRHADYPEHDAAVGIADAVGIDYLLDDDHRGRGLGARTLRQCARWALELYPDARCCVATPAQANTASWRALERAGFVRHHECQPPDEPPAYAYVATR